MTGDASDTDATLAADFRALFDASEVGMARIEAKTRRIVAANDRFCAMLDYPSGGLVGLTTDALLHPDDSSHGESLYTAMNTAGAASREARLLTRTGGTVWVRVEAALVRDPDGKARRSIALIHDLTAAIDDRERSRLAFQAAKAGAWEFRVADRALIWSPELRALYGLKPDEASPDYRTWRTQLHPDDRRRAEPPIETVGPDGHYSTEFRAWIDGEWRWLGSRACVFRGPDGEPARVVGINIDLSEPRAAADAMAAAVERFRAAVDAMSGVLWTNTPDGQMTGEQHGWAALTGQTQAEYSGYGWSAAIHPDDATGTVAAWSDAVATLQPFAFEHRVRVASGAWRWFAARALPVVIDSTVIEWVGVHTDIDDARTAELALRARVAEAVAQREATLAQFHEIQKLETIGQLTGGVAHDFNNLLTPIIGSLDLLARRDPDPRAARLIDGAMTAAERAKNLVQRLLAFARRQALDACAVDIAALTQGLRDLIERSVGRDIELVIDDACDVYAQVDPAQLELALLNLALNARDAMAHGGRLSIDCAVEGDEVRITVADTGAGMDEATRTRAIEPFFTTKGIGRGTGLGLSMVHGLAAQSGGRLEIESAPGEGTRVILWLPVAGAPADARDDRPPVQSIVDGLGRRVLLVDDEALPRAAVAAMLGDLGYTVTEAGGPEAALAEATAGEFDAVITDYMMPTMNGASLIAALRDARPGLPALLITGFADYDRIDPALARLAKPFRRDDLARALGEALAAQ